MRHEGVGLVSEGQRIVGVEARSPEDEVRIEAGLVVACDGRHSTTRRGAGLEVQEFGVPIDVLWFRISRHAQDPDQVLGNINYGKALILINRGDYFQAGLIIRKGSLAEIQAEGLDAFREEIVRIAPYLEDRAWEIESWDQIKLLTVQINRLRRWHLPGLLCIGDAAHAMSPAGGAGINLAIQDAVAAANLLARPLHDGEAGEKLLAEVQRRREFPTRVTQRLQVLAHQQFDRVFDMNGPLKAPWQLKLIEHVPGRKYVMGYVVGVGVRPEHVAGAEKAQQGWTIRKAAVAAGALAGALAVAWRVLRR